MFKKICLFVVVCWIGVTISGCAAQLAVGALEAAGHLGAFNSSGASNLMLVLGTEIERHNVGKYEVGISGGFYKNDPGIIFMAYDQGRRTKFVYFEKKNPDDMKMINDFNQMGEAAKKQQIRNWFIEYAKLDLGPIESETTETLPPAISAPSFPTPGFAPTPSKPR